MSSPRNFATRFANRFPIHFMHTHPLYIKVSRPNIMMLAYGSAPSVYFGGLLSQQTTESRSIGMNVLSLLTMEACNVGYCIAHRKNVRSL